MKHRGRRPFAAASCALLVLSLVLTGWRAAAEPDAYHAPPEPRRSLESLLRAPEPDYRALFLQTGLGRPAIAALWDAPGGKRRIRHAQEDLYRTPRFLCEANSPISSEERAAAPLFSFLNLEDGDILLTPCSHTFGWRNGHAAIVVDAAAGETLESVVLGEDACVQTTEKWQRYPQVLVLRVRALSEDARAQAAAWALSHLDGVPYCFTVGVLSDKLPGEDAITGTQCAHLVWLAYAAQGIDLDANGGLIVTPADLAISPRLELVQAYGADLAALLP